MRNVRVFFSKKGRMRFASHLDMNRIMTRLIRLSGLPVWYTEGFNQHPYITFALPLSLGFTSEYEIMDIRILDDDMTDEKISNALNSVFPDGLRVLSVAERIKKSGDIAFAEFLITFENKDGFTDLLFDFLSQGEILTEKKTKKGQYKTIDIAPMIQSFKIDKGENTVLKIILAAGGESNLNPVLLMDALGYVPEYSVCRTMIYDSNLESFR